MNYETTDELQDLESVQYQIFQNTNLWSQRTPHKVLVSATSAVNALGELSPGGALMRGFQEQSLARKLKKEETLKFQLIKLNYLFKIQFFIF